MRIKRFALKYPTITHDGQEVSNGVQCAIKALYSEGERVTAIKFMRTLHGFGLKEAKDLCDVIAEYDNCHLNPALTENGMIV